MNELKQRVVGLLIFFLSFGCTAHASKNTAMELSVEQTPQIAIISTRSTYDEKAKQFPALTYTQGLLEKGIVPHKALFHFESATTPGELSNKVKQLYNKGVKYIIGSLLSDDIAVILKALPQTNDYVIISTSYTADEPLSNNIIRFNISDSKAAPDYLTLYHQQFGEVKPVVFYGAREWAQSESKIFKDIALKTIAFNNLDELKKLITQQVSDKISPIIIFDAQINDLLEQIPTVSNPIILGNIASFMNLSEIKNPAINELSIYTIYTDVKNLDTYQVGKNIMGRPISPDISNLIYAMYYATDTIYSGQTKGSVWDRVLVTHGAQGSGLMNAQGEFSTYAVLLTQYQNKAQQWNVLRKIEHYGKDFQFNCQEKA